MHQNARKNVSAFCNRALIFLTMNQTILIIWFWATIEKFFHRQIGVRKPFFVNLTIFNKRSTQQKFPAANMIIIDPGN